MRFGNASLAIGDDGDSMMLRSRACVFSFFSQRFPQALICSAGLAIAGCGGRFLESPSALTRSSAATSAEDVAGTSSLDDSQPESTRSRGFLASLFRRDAQPDRSSRDPFLDTPVFAQVDTPDAPRGIAQLPDSEVARAVVPPEGRRQIVRPPRRSDPAARQAVDEAVARIAVPETPAQRSVVPNHQLPEWATGSRQIAAQTQRAQQGQRGNIQQPRPDQSSALAYEGRVRISRLGTEALPARTAAPAPSPSRRVESLLAAARESAQRVDPPVARPAAPVVTQFPEETRRASAPPQRQTQPPQPQPQPQFLASRPVRNLENPFEHIVAATEPPSTSTTRSPDTVREMPTVPIAAPTTDGPRHELANHGGTAIPRFVDDSPWSEDEAGISSFPVLNEWRGVRANAALALTDPDNRDSELGFDHDAAIHQTGFEERPGPDQLTIPETAPTLLSDGLAMAEQDRLRPFRANVNVATAPAPGTVTVPPPPPLDASTGIRALQNAPIESEDTGSRVGWFVALLIAAGLGILVYRRRLQHGDS